MENFYPIDIYVPGDPGDPRLEMEAPEGVVIHRGPLLHPDDVTEVNGIPVTSVSRTLIDLAEVVDADELRAYFASARNRGLLDFVAFDAARARVEWRPSLATLDTVADQFR